MLGRVKRNGALTIRDIDDDKLREKDHEWASRKPSRRALQLAFFRGILTVSQREGMLKTYELTTRHFGWDRLPRPAPESERMAYLADRALRAQGVVSLDSICHLDAPRKAAIRKLIGQRVRRKELVPVALEGAKHEHWVTPEMLEAPLEPVADIVHILNPFDPLVIQRKRLAAIFDYEHRFEAYVPKAEACLRLLLAAGAGRRRDRRGAGPENRSRARQAAHPEMDLVAQGRARGAAAEIEAELDRFERFQLAR